MDEITEQMTDLLQSYRHYHLHHMEIDGEETRDLKEKADIARDTFRAMFRGRLESEQFLSDEAEDSVLESLRSWALNLSPVMSGREVRGTLTECSALLMRLTSEQNSLQEPAIWPYVRKIKSVCPVVLDYVFIFQRLTTAQRQSILERSYP